jgi:P27 family predicted phage terminase small subunit
MSRRSLGGHYGRTLADVPASELGPVGRCPAWLDPEAKRFWKQTAPELERLGLLTALDRGSFAVLCSAWADVVAASAMLQKEGFTYQTKRGTLLAHPANRILHRAMQSFLESARQFGMTPAGRQRIKVAAVTAAAPDSLEEFLNGNESKSRFFRSPA